MAPKEEPCPPMVSAPVCNSSFWSRLNTLPLVQRTIKTTKDLYCTSKEKNALLGRGLEALEYGVSFASSSLSQPVKKVTDSIVEKYPFVPTAATKLDNLACTYLETLENKVPAINSPPKQIIKSVKRGASGMIHSSVRRMMKTYPGQKVVNGLDSMIAWSEATLQSYAVAKEDATEKVEETPGGENEKVQEMARLYLCNFMQKNGVVIPVKLYLEMLRVVKHMLANMAGIKTKPNSVSESPRKSVNLERRRKASPHKRIPKKGILVRMTHSALGLLGLKKKLMLDDLQLSPKSAEQQGIPLNAVRNEKRKHDDLLEESECSDAESLNLASALDQYNSEDDSDYMPGEESSDDSLEYSGGDTESDLDTEEVGISKRGGKLHRLKSPVKAGQNKKTPQKSPKKPMTDKPPTQPEQSAPIPLGAPESHQ